VIFENLRITIEDLKINFAEQMIEIKNVKKKKIVICKLKKHLLVLRIKKSSSLSFKVYV